jgi:hypothetical protein
MHVMSAVGSAVSATLGSPETFTTFTTFTTLTAGMLLTINEEESSYGSKR